VSYDHFAKGLQKDFKRTKQQLLVQVNRCAISGGSSLVAMASHHLRLYLAKIL
jgi:hypothetical protein